MRSRMIRPRYPRYDTALCLQEMVTLSISFRGFTITLSVAIQRLRYKHYTLTNGESYCRSLSVYSDACKIALILTYELYNILFLHVAGMGYLGCHIQDRRSGICSGSLDPL